MVIYYHFQILFIILCAVLSIPTVACTLFTPTSAQTKKLIRCTMLWRPKCHLAIGDFFFSSVVLWDRPQIYNPSLLYIFTLKNIEEILVPFK